MVRQLRRDGVRAGRHRVRRPCDCSAYRRATKAENQRSPRRRIGFIPICSKGWRSRAQSGLRADITGHPGPARPVPGRDHARHGNASSRLAAIGTPWMRPSASRPWLKRWADTAGRTSVTDQGSQFTGRDFTGALKDADVAISMELYGPSSLSGCGAPSSTRRSSCTRTGPWLQRGRTRQAREWIGLLQRRAAPFRPRRRDPAEAYGAGRPVDMMDKPDGLPTSPQARFQKQDVINKGLAA